MGNISRRIDEIIEARKQKLIIIQDALKKAELSEKAITEFKSAQNRLDPDKIGISAELAAKISNISFVDYENSLRAVRAELERLEKRFSRDKINISFVGRAGQGKSLVLQKISGLGGTVIPSATGSDCTGAKSIITNTVGTERPYAEITFFTETEMIDIINVYLENILGSSEKNIRSLDEVSGLSDIINDPGISRTKEPTKRELRKYIDHMDELRENLGRRPIRIEEENIEEYVAMYKSTDDSVKYYKYLGVKCADIHCTFPKEDAGKIILVDTIGMGSQSLGVGESLLDTVKNDSDAVIYMQRPDSKRSHLGDEDTNISNDIIAAIREDCAKMMMFWVLNHVSSGEACNTNGVKIVQDQFEDAKYPVAELLTVDCISEEEVENKLLTPVLETISQNIGAIDAIYLEQARALMGKLYSSYTAICDKVDKSRAKVVNSDFRKQYRSEIKETIEVELQGAIRDKAKELHKLINTEYDTNQAENKQPDNNKILGQASEEDKTVCKPMRDKVEDILSHLSDAIPSNEYIVHYLRKGAVDPHSAYIHMMNIMRMRIIDAFHALDETLSEETMKVKECVIHILTDADKGKLGAVVPYQPETDTPSEWIEHFINKNSDIDHFDLIKPAFESLERFNISVEGFLIHEIRCTLTQIDPNFQAQLKGVPSNDSNDNGEIAECIIGYLKDALFSLRQKIRQKVAEFYPYPNKAFFAVVKDFHDRISYSRKSSIEDVKWDIHDIGVDEAWEELYDEWCELIWKDEAEAFNGKQESAAEWDKAVKQLKDYGKKENFTMKK